MADKGKAAPAATKGAEPAKDKQQLEKEAAEKHAKRKAEVEAKGGKLIPQEEPYDLGYPTAAPVHLPAHGTSAVGDERLEIEGGPKAGDGPPVVFASPYGPEPRSVPAPEPPKEK